MKKYYIKERHNLQLGVYYIGCGQLTKKEAKSNERVKYGHNVMLAYDTEQEYMDALTKLQGQVMR